MLKRPLYCSAWAVVLFGALTSVVAGTTLSVPYSSARGVDSVEQSVRQFTANLATLSAREREVMAQGGRRAPIFTLPIRVKLEGAPSRQRFPAFRGSPGIALQFESSGARAFPSNYQALLTDVYATVQSRLNLVFGAPAEAGTVWVRNYDADIPDRHAVAGGIYIDNNGSGQREIRFPVYADGIGIKPEVAAVNFVHTLLLAYMGSKQLPFEAWDEGLVRAATLRICRTPGALPATLDTEAIEQTLQSSYDLGSYYDWNNQPALSNPTFIAPNLVNTQLPLGGSVGGLYLLRYLMAGSAFQKVLVEYPSFASSLLTSYYANTGAYQSISQLNALGQTLTSSGVEGLSFGSWTARQFILDPSLSPGLKLQVQPFPILAGLEGPDFGVFAIQAHYFETLPNGNENLLAGTSYPIFWSTDFTRFFGSGQDDRIDIVQAYGNVVPNFPGTPTGGEPYRVTVDVPVQDQIARVSLPAGAIATASNPTPKDVYGTITGVAAASGQTFTVEVQYGSTVHIIPVSNFAFGATITDTPFDGSLPMTVRVKRTTGQGTTTILTRRVNKGPGDIGLVLDVGPRTSFDVFLQQGIQMMGFPIQTTRTRLDQVLGLSENATMGSRWNPANARFEFFPRSGSLREGHSHFVRLESGGSLSVPGYQASEQPISVALRQGWNMVCNPLANSISRSELTFVADTGFPKIYSEAVGDLIGSDIFEFVPGASDAITGMPETGSYSSITGLAAGKPFFIKVLSPTGATIVFGGTGSGSRSTPVVPKYWNIALSLTGAGERATAVFGQRQGATNAIDRAFDIEAPPGSSGLSIKVNEGLYRATKAFGNPATWTINLANLKPGRTYSFAMTRETNRPSTYVFRDPVRSYLTIYSGSATYTFTATSATRTLLIDNNFVQ
ncbi:MAG: hypothetical protein JNK63_00785 [Chthonomonas sp.]|nr:hypothetical protein [Chthonomonas sp.]